MCYKLYFLGYISMAFMLPWTIGGMSTFGGFLAGYFYQQPAQRSISEADIKKLVLKSPHKDIHAELLSFTRDKLSAVVNNTPTLTDEQEFFKKMKIRLDKRRANIAVD
jgi:hypothetical protein